MEHEKKSGNQKKAASSVGSKMMRGLGFMAEQVKKGITKHFTEVSLGEAFYCTETLKIFQSGVLLLDEVDLLLHPLRSELNWPLGEKTPLDFTRSAVLGAGVRWQLQWHFFDAIFYSSEERMTVKFEDSMQAIGILKRLREVIEKGKSLKALQQTPHLVVLDRSFYHKQMRPILSEWVLLFMRSKKMGSVEVSDVKNGIAATIITPHTITISLTDHLSIYVIYHRNHRRLQRFSNAGQSLAELYLLRTGA